VCNRRKQAVLGLTLLVVSGCGSTAAQKGHIVRGTGFTFRRFKPPLWDKVVPELDRAAAAVANQQQGTVSDPRTVTIAGQKARRYDVAYTAEGKQLVERIAFVLRGKTEYLLLCRYERGGSTEACDGLLTSFRLAAA
jgi:hypothetical protein